MDEWMIGWKGKLILEPGAKTKDKRQKSYKLRINQ